MWRGSDPDPWATSKRDISPLTTSRKCSRMSDDEDEKSTIARRPRLGMLAECRANASSAPRNSLGLMVAGAASTLGARLSSPDGKDIESGWIQVYAPKDPTQFPHAEAAKAELALVNYEEVFAKQVDMYLDALALESREAEPVSDTSDRERR